MLRSLMLTVCFSMATLACGGGQSPEAKRTSFDLQVTLEGLVAYVHDEQPVAEGGEPVESWWALMPNAAYDRENADPAGHAFPRGVEYDLVRNRCTLWYPPHFAVVRTHQTAGGPLESMTDLRSYDVRFELEFSDDNAVEPGATFADGHSQPVNLGDVMPGWDYVEDRWVADEVQPSKELATRVLFQHGRISSETIGYEFRRHVVQLEDDACTVSSPEVRLYLPVSTARVTRISMVALGSERHSHVGAELASARTASPKPPRAETSSAPTVPRDAEGRRLA